MDIVILLKTVIEGIAIFILALAVIKALQKLSLRRSKIDREEKQAQVRLYLGVALALSLEFLLAAISAIRTFLNFFLEKEVRELAREKLQKSL